MKVVVLRNIRNGSMKSGTAHKVSVRDAQQIADSLEANSYMYEKYWHWRVANTEDFTPRSGKYLERVAEKQSFSIRGGRVVEMKDIGDIRHDDYYYYH